MLAPMTIEVRCDGGCGAMATGEVAENVWLTVTTGLTRFDVPTGVLHFDRWACLASYADRVAHPEPLAPLTDSRHPSVVVLPPGANGAEPTPIGGSGYPGYPDGTGARPKTTLPNTTRARPMPGNRRRPR